MFRKIASYSASIYGVSIGSSALSFAVMLLIARSISKEALGLFGFYLAVYAFLGLVVCAGLNQALVRFFGKNSEDRAELTRIILAITTLVAGISWPAAALAHFFGSTGFGWGLTTLPFMVITVLGASEYRARFARKQEISLTLSISLLNSCLTIALVMFWSRPNMAPIVGDFLSLAIPGSVLFTMFCVRDGFKNPLRLFGANRGDTARRLLVFSLPLTIAGIAFVAYSNAAPMLIRGIVGLAALAEFYFAIQLLRILEKPMEILARVTLAGFSQDPDVSPAAHKQLVTFNMAVFPLVAGVLAYAAPMLLAVVDFFMDGVRGETLVEKYAVAPLFLAVFAAAIPARCVEYLVSTLAIARGRPDVHRNSHVLSALISLPTLAVLVWFFGAWGGAVMPLVYQTIYLSLQFQQLKRVMPEIIRQTAWAAVVGTVLLAVLLLGTRLPGAIFWFPPGAAAYLVLGHLLGGWDLRLLLPEGRFRAPLPWKKSGATPPLS